MCSPHFYLILWFIFISFILIITNQLTSPRPNNSFCLKPGVGFVSSVSFAAHILSVTTQLDAATQNLNHQVQENRHPTAKRVPQAPLCPSRLTFFLREFRLCTQPFPVRCCGLVPSQRKVR